MIQLNDLSLGFDSRTLLSHVSALFPPGKLTALIGRNGSGKSTLLRAMAGLNHRYSGEILLCGRDIRHMNAGEMARQLAFVTTERTRVPNLRCEDVVAIGRAPYTNWIGRMQQTDREIVMHSLRAVGMESYVGRTVATLSDGENQRVMIARALAQDTPVMLLDEPTSFLDLPGRYELCDLLEHIAHEEGKTVIFSTHELDLARERCDTLALITRSSLQLIPSSTLHTLTTTSLLEKF